jgi:hypothetical protein
MIPRNAGACQDGTSLVNQIQNTAHYQGNAFRIFENFPEQGINLHRRFESLGCKPSSGLEHVGELSVSASNNKKVRRLERLFDLVFWWRLKGSLTSS